MLDLVEQIASITVSISVIIMFFYGFRKYSKDKEDAAKVAVTKEFHNLELNLANNVSLLRFHGITEDDLTLHGITHQEFAYLVSSFTLAGVYFDISKNKKNLYAPDSYRDNMFKTKDMRKAWPLLKRMYLYRDFIEEMDKLCEKHSTDDHECFE